MNRPVLCIIYTCNICIDCLNTEVGVVFYGLNDPPSVKEVVDIINGLKSRKSRGKDNLVNEY